MTGTAVLGLWSPHDGSVSSIIPWLRRQAEHSCVEVDGVADLAGAGAVPVVVILDDDLVGQTGDDVGTVGVAGLAGGPARNEVASAPIARRKQNDKVRAIILTATPDGTICLAQQHGHCASLGATRSDLVEGLAHIGSVGAGITERAVTLSFGARMSGRVRPPTTSVRQERIA